MRDITTSTTTQAVNTTTGAVYDVVTNTTVSKKVKLNYYGEVKFKDKLDPVNSWTFAFVTGHEYKIHWVNTGVDFTEMQLTMSDKWLDSDRPIILHHNHTDVRVHMNVTIGGADKENNTIPADKRVTTAADKLSFETGMHLFNNDTATRRFSMVVSGQNAWANKVVKLKTWRCFVCQEKIEETEELDLSTRYWS